MDVEGRSLGKTLEDRLAHAPEEGMPEEDTLAVGTLAAVAGSRPS